MKTRIKGTEIYKPLKSGKGSAAQFAPDESLECVWLEITNQNGVKSFDWNSKITFKLGEVDILKLIYWFELARTPLYKELMVSKPSEFDDWMNDMCTKRGQGKPFLCELVHKDRNKDTTAILSLRPNGAKYGGGFNMSLFKKFDNGKTIAHNINIDTTEALGVLYTLEKTQTALMAPKLPPREKQQKKDRD